MLRKAGNDWEESLNRSTRALNSRIVGHLGVAPSSILLGVGPTPSSVDPTLRSVHAHPITVWRDKLLDPAKHKELIGRYFTYRAQLHDIIRQKSDEKKDYEAARFNAGIREIRFMIDQPVMLFQKDVGKLKAPWRGPFVVRGYGGTHGISYTLKQFNGRNIRGLFHGNYLKPFVPRKGYLSDPATDLVPPGEQTIRAPRKRNEERIRLFPPGNVSLPTLREVKQLDR